VSDDVLLLAFATVIGTTFVLAWILTAGDLVWTYRIVLLQAVLQIGLRTIQRDN